MVKFDKLLFNIQTHILNFSCTITLKNPVYYLQKNRKITLYGFFYLLLNYMAYTIF